MRFKVTMRKYYVLTTFMYSLIYVLMLAMFAYVNLMPPPTFN